MFGKAKKWQRNIAIFVIVSNGVLLGISFSQVNGSASIFFPAAGMIAGLYYIFNKRVAVSLFSAVFVTQLVYRILAINESLIQSLILALFFVLAAFVEAVLFSYVMKKVEHRFDGAFSLVQSSKFVLSIVVAVSMGALLGTLGLYIFNGNELSLITTYGYYFVGDSMGIIVFASLILNHHHYDDPMFEKEDLKLIPSIVYIVIYMTLLVFIFGDIGNDILDFGTFQVLIILMYVISAFTFSFRMIGLNNILLLLVFNFLHFNFYTGDAVFNEVAGISLFLIVASSIASIIKIVILERSNNLALMRTAKDSLERIIISTNDLVKIENTMPEEDHEFGREYLKNMFEIACEIYPKFDRASCNTINGKYVEFVAAKGYNLQQLNNMEFLASEFVWALSEPDIVTNTDYDKVFEDSSREKEFVETYGHLKQSIRFTVYIGENKYAGISFDIYAGSEYSFDDKDVNNFRSFQNLMNSYYKIGILNNEKDVLKDDIVLSLVRTLELYDLYTGGHSEQVADLCAEFGKTLGLPGDEVRELYWAGIVHDIGKIGLPADVLNMSRRFTADEYEQVKKHPKNGYDILSRSQSLSSIADVVLHHHEWWNGNGYPEGLKMEEIPYHSRILHICDAVDAMAKDRVYRKALSEDEIVSELELGKGKQFSPKIADKMIKFIQSGVLYTII